MEQALNALGSPQRPEMPEHFWEGYWHRLAQRMEKEERTVPRSTSVYVRAWDWFREKWTAQPLLIPLVRAAGILGLLMLGVLAGHYWWPQDEAQIAESKPPQASAIQVQAGNWMERSKILLLGVMNEEAAEAGQIDFSHQRQVSRHLLAEARTLSRELEPAANRQLLQLIGQLELILLQIANLEAEHDLAAVELVREGIAREGILLKINISEMAQQGKQSPAPVAPEKKAL
jgi:hypothetical protein